jgi:hypothetical protein
MNSFYAEKTIEKAFKDDITKLLLKNSNLTSIQFETLIIDLLINLLSDNIVTIKEKTIFRSKNVSRGSFSRSLQQARKNVISSIFTIILLSYVGVFDASPFEEYQILANKLKDYTNIITNSKNKVSKTLVNSIERELIEGIKGLIQPISIKVL